MQFKLITLCALLTVTNAITVPPKDIPALLSVLPSSALAIVAKSGQGAFSKHVASEFSAGETPSWFTKLPSAIQTDLVPALASMSGSSVPASSMVVTKKSTTITKAANPKSKAKAAMNSSSSSSSSPNAGAAMPTAVIGAGLAGVVGVMGLIAL